MKNLGERETKIQTIKDKQCNVESKIQVTKAKLRHIERSSDEQLSI